VNTDSRLTAEHY